MHLIQVQLPSIPYGLSALQGVITEFRARINLATLSTNGCDLKIFAPILHLPLIYISMLFYFHLVKNDFQILCKDFLNMLSQKHLLKYLYKHIGCHF